MSAVPPLFATRRIDGIARRVLGCLSVSALTTGLSLATLTVLTTSLGVTAWTANVLATGAGTFVSYRLNRRWVWSRSGASDPWREVLPFWGLSFAGLVLSTVAVAGADAWAQATHLDSGPRTLAVLTASVAGYAVLWVAQFVMLERVLFAERPAADATTPPRESSTFDLDRSSTKERAR